MQTDTLQQKQAVLFQRLDELGSALVALSGGVDSGLLLAAAMQRLGPARVLAVTIDSPFHAAAEKTGAARLAAELGAPHRFLALVAEDEAPIRANGPERCYLCKRRMLLALIELARTQGLAWVIHGANADDLGQHRPGWRAAQELGVRAPLVEAGLGKAEIRALARQRGLGVWNRPAMSCLATRIPTGTLITDGALRLIEQAEQVLQALGIEAGRVRLHGDLARIEVPQTELVTLIQPEPRARLVAGLRRLGLRYVTLDLEGYRPSEPLPPLADQEESEA